MIAADAVLARLRGPAMDELAGLIVDFLLSRRAADLVDADWIADQALLALEAAANSPAAEARLREQVERLRDRVPEGRLGDRVPDEVRRPLREVLRRPYQPDRELVGRLLDHSAFEELVRDVLVGALLDFTTRLRAAPQQAAGRLGILGKRVQSAGAGVLGGLQEGVLGGLGHTIEARAERKIRDFVEGALRTVIARIADHLCSEQHADNWGAMRAHALDVLLGTDNRVLAREFDKLHPGDLVDTLAATARALTGRAGFRDEIASVARLALDALGDRSLEDLLRESGLDAEAGGEVSADAAARAVARWKDELRRQLARQGRALVATPGFEAWLAGLLAEPADG